MVRMGTVQHCVAVQFSHSMVRVAEVNSANL